MTAILARYWPHLAGLFMLACAVGLILLRTVERNQARIERDMARTELASMTAGLEAERISTHAATDAAERCSADHTESNLRFTSVLAGARAEADRYRAQARACVSPAAVAERLGKVFP